MKRCTVAILCAEPFRFFFPLAVLASIGGAALWPMLHHGLILAYPGFMHARIMTAGLAGFLIGFLGTAFPRLVAAPALRCGEVFTVAALWLAALVAFFFNRIVLGDALFALCLSLFALCLLWRWLRHGADTPPPGFPVALAGLLGGALASGVLALHQRGVPLGAFGFQLAHLLLYQGMALLALLGIVPFFGPRLFGHENAHHFEDSASPPPGWWPRFAHCASVGVAVQASFVLEAAGWPQWGMGLRAGLVAALVLLGTPLLRRARSLTTGGTALRVALLAIIAAFGWAALDPPRRPGILHLLFIGGFGLAMLSVAVRVVLGHAGRLDSTPRQLVWLRVLIGLVLLGAATRVTADFVPAIRTSHLDYAAALWALLALLWLWKLRRPFLAADTS